MKNKSLLLLIILIFILAILIGYRLHSSDNKSDDSSKKKNNVSSTNNIVIVDNLSFNVDKDGTFSKLDNNIVSDKKYQYNIYTDNKNIGKGYLRYSSRWNVLNKDKEYVHYDKSLVAYYGDIDFQKPMYYIRNISNDEKSFLKKEFNIDNFDYLYVNQVVNGDFDLNGVDDKIYILSNYRNPQDTDDFSNLYNLIVADMNGESYMIIYENYEKQNDTPALYKFNNALYLNKTLYVFINADYPPQAINKSPYMSVLQFKNKKFKNVLNI